MKRFRLTSALAVCAILVFSFGLILFLNETAQAARDALAMCASRVVPFLFPFFVVSRLITGLGLADGASRLFDRLMRPLFGVGGTGAAALVLGMTGGYPIGAATCAELYREDLCSRRETERLLAFCNNSGPAFIIGAIGAGVFSSVKVGALLFFIHILAALTVGVLLRIFAPIRDVRNSSVARRSRTDIRFSRAFTDAVSGALTSCLAICAYVVFFSIAIRVFTLLRVLPLLSQWLAHVLRADCGTVTAFFGGILEITVGTFSVAHEAAFPTAFVLTAFMLGWGGLSVHCQAMCFLSEHTLNTAEYFLGKLLHGVVSALYAALLCNRIGDISVNAFADSAATTPHFAAYFALVPVALAVFYLFCKKRWKNAKK